MSTLGLNDHDPIKSPNSTTAIVIIVSSIIGYGVGRMFGVIGILVGALVYVIIKLAIKLVRQKRNKE